MREQFKILLAFFIDGILIGSLFDIFRATRRSYKTSNIITYVEDVIFWILAGILTLYIIDVFTDGKIRLYMVLMLICGYIIYMITISKFILKINTKLLNTIKYIVKIIVKIILKPLRTLQKLVKNTIRSKKN